MLASRLGGLIIYRLAVGAQEAAIEDSRSHLALILAFEQRTTATFVAPFVARLVRRAIEDHPVALDPVDVGAAQRMMSAPAFWIRLGQDDPVAGDLVDRPDMLVVAADDFHMFPDLAEKSALLLPPVAPAAEVVLEARLVLAAIVVIVAVELAHVAVAPAAVVRIV